jgi:hypothetical protein
MRNVHDSRSSTLEIWLKAAQMRVFRCDKRFRVLVAGRRFGKHIWLSSSCCGRPAARAA